MAYVSFDLEKLNQILSLAVKNGNEILRLESAPTYGDSNDCEDFLVSLLKAACLKFGFEEKLIEHHKGHSFPDVTIKNTPFGIELKGAKAHRTFNGNSVMASTMRTGLKKVFLMYWIGDSKEVGFRDYFECVATPVVTHSPRFQLDIDLKPCHSMFGSGSEKVGLVEDVIFGGKSINSEKIIQWMANKAQEKGESPWWIATDESLPIGSTGLSKFTNLSNDKKKIFLKEAFLVFPKILDRTSPNKYHGLFEWAIQTKSVYTTRDDYSAGGKVQINLPAFSKSAILVPQVIQVAAEAFQSKGTIFVNEMGNSTSLKFISVDSFLKSYTASLKNNLLHIYEEVEKNDANRIGKDAFATTLAAYLISKIDKKTLIV